MYYLALLAISLGLLLPMDTLSAVKAKYVIQGNYDIAGPGRRGGFMLDDGNTYKPLSKFQKNRVKSWQLGDTILVLRIVHSHRYLLVNKANGERAKCKITVRSRLPLSF